MRVARAGGWRLLLLPAIGVATWALISCSVETTSPDEIRSSRSYQGHASDVDINNFVTVYPHTVGTRLDDCQTCHTGGEVTDDDNDAVYANPCDYCHYIIHPHDGWTGLPTTMAQTLNSYGTAYDGAGRNTEALQTIAEMDSDGDGYSN
jgi:hypothetical protein